MTRFSEFTEHVRGGGASRGEGKAESSGSVLEFVAFLLEFVRDDLEMTRTIDRALKERYGPKGI
jgi:hypothetical protein